MSSNKTLIEDLDDDSSEDLQGLKEEISLNNAQLIDLVTETDRFILKIKQLNESGTNLIATQEFKVGLIYLQQAQKILQYAASCGKTIDRSLIIATLQNQACIYQKLWQLEKSSNYMQAIIFNTNAYLEHPPPIIINSQIINTTSVSYINLSNLVRKRLQISFYYLQFSAVSSQLDKHQVALGSAINALGTMKTLCQECYNYEKHFRKDDQSLQYGYRGMLKQLSTVKESVQIQKYETYLMAARRQLKKLKKTMGFGEKVPEKLSQFAIGSVMQISICSMASLEKQPSLKNQITLNQKVYKAIYISIAFFTMATELRLISVQTYSENDKKQSEEFKKSELYHLNSIIIAAKYIQYETQYLAHILKSFKTHYNIDLNVNFSESQQTTDETNSESVGILLTPTDKSIRSIQNSPVSPFKLIKQEQRQRQSSQKEKIKIPLLHLKKKKRKGVNGKSKQKISGGNVKTFPKTPRNDNQNLKRRIETAFENFHSPIEMNKEEKSLSKWKNKNKKSGTKSKSKRQCSTQFFKDKVQKKAKKCKDQYFGQPEKKKVKNKLNPSNSVTKAKVQSPIPTYSQFGRKDSTKLIKNPFM